MKVLIIEGTHHNVPSQIAARLAHKAILAGKTVEYREIRETPDIPKVYGLEDGDSFLEFMPSKPAPTGWAYFMVWKRIGNKLQNPQESIIQQAMRNGKLHYMVGGQWVRSSLKGFFPLVKAED